MGNLIKRSITGILYIGVIVGCILWGNAGVLLLSLVFSALGVLEFEVLSDRNYSPRAILIYDIIGAMLLTFSIAMCYTTLPTESPLFMLLWLLWLLGRMTLELYSREEDALNHLCHSLTAQVYIALPLGLMNLVNALSGGDVVLLMFILICLNDTGAYVVGVSCGRHRLFERISPKKSWEGFWGGMAFCIGGAIAAYYIVPGVFSSIMPIGFWVGYGVAVSVFATWGDLVESMFKRTLGIKDSGHILPGHGGILDRIDSLLFVVPMTFVYLIIYMVV